MPRRVAIKRVKVTGWHEDKDTGEDIARLKITYEGKAGARVSGRMHVYISRSQLDEFSMAHPAVHERQITLEDLHPAIYEWLFCDYEKDETAHTTGEMQTLEE